MFGRQKHNKGTAIECNRLYGENEDLRREVNAMKKSQANENQLRKNVVDLHVGMLQDELGAVMMYCPQQMEWVISRRSVMMSRRLSEFFEPFLK